MLPARLTACSPTFLSLPLDFGATTAILGHMSSKPKTTRRKAEHPVALRFTRLDLERIERIIQRGDADNKTGAIRYALRLADEKVAA